MKERGARNESELYYINIVVKLKKSLKDLERKIEIFNQSDEKDNQEELLKLLSDKYEHLKNINDAEIERDRFSALLDMQWDTPTDFIAVVEDE